MSRFTSRERQYLVAAAQCVVLYAATKGVINLLGR